MRDAAVAAATIVVALAMWFRTPQWSKPCTRVTTTALLALAATMLLKDPRVGGNWVERGIHRISGLHNMAHLLGDAVGIVAAALLVVWSLRIWGRERYTRYVVIGTGGTVLALFATFLLSNVVHAPATDDISHLGAWAATYNYLCAVYVIAANGLILFVAAQAAVYAPTPRGRAALVVLSTAAVCGLVNAALRFLRGSDAIGDVSTFAGGLRAVVVLLYASAGLLAARPKVPAGRPQPTHR